jgi:16S rRNA (cytidine1402-2'-O)-methyltransferase
MQPTSNTTSSGTLFVVATPIGHLEDITLRAIRTLKEAGLIAAEDTRHTRKLLTRYEISTPVVSYHDHNKEKRTPELIERLRADISIALVTDAGTPSISDPGYYLVRAAPDAGIPVVPVPGVSAFVAALSVAGLPTDSFVFIGFVPRKGAKRRTFLEGLKHESRTLVFYESPRRLLDLIEQLVDIIGDRRAVVARELTKIHEEVIRESLRGIVKRLSSMPQLKGECTLLVEGCKQTKELDRTLLLEELQKLHRETGRPLSDLVKEIASKYGLPRKAVYEESLKLKQERQ